MSKATELLEIVSAYTGNRITLGQASACVTMLLVDIVPPGELKAKNVMNILGHRLHPNDAYEIEHGFDGSVDKWLESGNRPHGYNQLFKDNYHFYKEQTCTQQTTDRETTKTLVGVPSEDPVATTPNKKEHTT